MRIERIELENWMSYPLRWVNPNAEDLPPTIDFTSEQLTLITGQNGSGKSAVLEAICYALFAKYPRGNQADAIRSGEGTATVRLYFSLPADSGQVQYCVERQLKARASNATLKQINEDGSEIALQTGQKPVTKHIETNLLRDVTYDAFISTVFLRQMEAGKFMELSQSKQREQLLKLCGLDIYEWIRNKASELRKPLAKEVSNLEKQLKVVNYATETYLTSKKKIANNLHKKRKELREREKIADDLLQKVKRVAILQKENDIRQQKLDRWEPILKQADKIRYAYQWQIVWNRVKGSLTEGREIKKRLHQRKIDIRKAELALDAAQKLAREAEEQYKSLQGEYREQNQSLNQIKDHIRSLEKTKDAAAKRLADTRQAKKLDQDIERIRTEQVQRKIQLANFREVKRQREYFNLLRLANLALPHVLSLLNDAQSEQKNAVEQEVKAQEATRKSTELQNTVLETEKKSKEVQKEVERLDSLQRGQEGKLKLYQATIKERNTAIEAGRCPTCGLEMSGDIGTHIHQEVHNLEQQIEELNTDLQSISRSLTISCSELKRLTGNIKEQKDDIRQFDSQAKMARTTAEKATKKATVKRDTAKARWQQHLTKWRVISTPDWLTSSEVTHTKIALELEALATIEAEYNQLRDMQSLFEAQASLLDTYESTRSQLSALSPIPETLLADLGQELQDAEKNLESAKNQRDHLDERLKSIITKGNESNKEHNKAQKGEKEADKHLDELKITQRNDKTNLSKIRASLVSEQQKIASQFSELAVDLLLAIDDSEVHLRLKRTAKSSEEEALKLRELQEAEAHSTRVQAQIEMKQDELDSLLEVVAQTSEAQALSELKKLQHELKQLDEEVTNADRDVAKTEGDYETLQEIEPQLEIAKSQSWAYQQIEDALYPGTATKPSGILREQITQRLMEKIAQEASRILQDLGWHMAIVYSKQDGFSVKDKNYDVVRQYKQFSGGERFAVAIAVALAVGQATHGAGNIGCLFIDEGFGALDANNRSRITTDAIGKLIEKGWRDQVVVITHLDDMKEHFPHRIELKREDDSSVLVKSTEGFL